VEDLRLFGGHYKSYYPFIGVEFFEDRFWVNGQLNIVDKNRYSDVAYLIPSQKYLRERTHEWLAEAEKIQKIDENNRGRNVFFDDSKNTAKEYRVWETKMTEKGYEIHYIAELET
jgi:hypothetical protein